jgi:putative photosynthetic complex assembly protein 2
MQILTPILVAVGLWWLFTVALLYRTGRPVGTYRATMIGLSVLAGVAVYGAIDSLDRVTVIGAYEGFVSALVIWAWHEASYFLGFLTGPRPEACPPDVSTSKRFGYGVKASLYHELAVALTGLLLWLPAIGAGNRVVAATFSVLWLMRWSAKLNIFLGVRNLHREFWPERMRYLASFASEGRRSPMMAVSLIAGLGTGAWLLSQGITEASSRFDVTAAVLVSTLLALACIEHLFLVLRVPDEWLWKLGTAGQADERPEDARISVRASLKSSGRLPLAADPPAKTVSHRP